MLIGSCIRVEWAAAIGDMRGNSFNVGSGVGTRESDRVARGASCEDVFLCGEHRIDCTVAIGGFDMTRGVFVSLTTG